MNQIELKALAKINLGLDVLGRRENGYHDVRMVMQSIYLYDEVKIAKKKEPGITLTTNLKFLPTGDGNIAYKAAQLLMDEFDLKEGVQITLNKHIPVAAGLAGGSSNAAAVLFGMNRLFGAPDAAAVDGTWSEAWSRCSILYYARNCSGRRNRRRVKRSSGNAEMYGTDRQASDQCFNEDGV